MKQTFKKGKAQQSTEYSTVKGGKSGGFAGDVSVISIIGAAS
jgi:hypothetical protein